MLPITSNTAILTVSSLPKITISKQPINKTLTLGTTNLPTFSVEVNNIQGAQFKYQWYSSEINSNTNGTEISKATNASYTVNKFDVSVPQSKYYYVKITGSINGIELTPVFSNTATLTINALPSISIVNNIQNQEVYAKQIFNKPTFSVVVEPIKVQRLLTNDTQIQVILQAEEPRLEERTIPSIQLQIWILK